MDTAESELFINTFLMGLKAQEYVNRMLVQKLLGELKVNRNFQDE